MGAEPADAGWFDTKKAHDRYLRAWSRPGKFGTVGCVALDHHGHGCRHIHRGMTYKRHGRIGESPIIGAGTWADDRTCAISATGWGEYFIRTAWPTTSTPVTSRRDGPSGSGGPNDPRRDGRTGRGWRHRGHVQPRRACLFHEHARHVQGRTPSWRNTVSRPLRDGHRPSLNPFIEGRSRRCRPCPSPGPPPTRHGRAQCGLEHLVVLNTGGGP